MKDEQVGRELLVAVQDFTLDHSHGSVERFKDSMRDWGDEFRAVEPARLPAVDCLGPAVENAVSPARELLGLFEHYQDQLYWEQSYTKQDGVVPDAMLANYGFAEILGSRGPFVSNRIRAGIGIYGPGIEYPQHQHKAEEIYIPLSGRAQFTIGGVSGERGPGSVIFVSSNTPHGFTVKEDQALVVYYLWQAGDLRQISSFS